MSRILKPGQTVVGNLKVGVYQPSVEELSEEEASYEAVPETDAREEAEKGYALISEAKRKILERARNQAEQSAAGILEEAYSQRDKIVNTAAEHAEHMKEEAKKEGYDAGVILAHQDISRQLSDILRSVEDMGRLVNQQNQEQQEQLAELSLKIAEKILCRKISEDETAIAALVEKAVMSERDKRSIVVHLSDRTMRLVELLEEKLEPLCDKNDGYLRIKTEEQPPGYVRIETEEGIVDASVSVQLENLKVQLAALDKQA